MWQPCFQRGWKDLFLPSRCLGSELIVLQIHKSCVRRGISTEIWVVQPKSASHWRAEERGCYFFVSLCSLFNWSPWVRVFVDPGSHLSLERCIILRFHPMPMCHSCRAFLFFNPQPIFSQGSHISYQGGNNQGRHLYWPWSPFFRITESQDGSGWKGPHWSNILHPDNPGISPARETSHPQSSLFLSVFDNSPICVV